MTTPAPRSRGRRRARRALIALLVVTVVSALTLDRLFWQPSSDSPAQADAVVVIGGAGDRLAEAEKLIDEHYATTLVATNSIVDPAGGCPKVQARTHGTLICFIPKPFSTRGEARGVASLVKQHGWSSILLVLSTTQATRARIRSRRCYHAEMRVITVGVPSSSLVHLTLYEGGALLKAEFVERGC